MSPRGRSLPAGPGDVVAGRYVIEAVAGEGGMGIVYRATDRDRGEVVALKILHLEAGDGSALRQEGQMLLQLSHPSIVRCVAFGVDEAGRAYLATEWLEGETLRARLKQGPLGVAEAVGVARRVAEGLAAAHTWGVVHRDVTPGNVMLIGGDLGRVKVLDFGIAVHGRTHTGPVGTAGYAAPEQARGEGAVDARADVFSLGCVLYECLTGERPFAADSDVAMVARVLFDEAAPPSSRRAGIPDVLDSLLGRMLAKAPEGRPPHGAAVASELAAIEAELTSSTGRGERSVSVGEQRAATVLVARVSGAPEPLLEELRALGGLVDVVGDGILIAEFAGESSGAVERAFRAARGALAVRRFDASAPCTVATVRGGTGTMRAIDAAARRPGADVRLDADTARLLGERFELRTTAEGDFELVREAHGGPRRPARSSGPPPPPAPLLGKATPCVGREREIGLITSLFAESAGESVARVAILTGPSGIGKTRVREETLARIQGDARAVWIAGADPTQTSTALAVLAQVVRSAAASAGEAPAEPLHLALRRLATGALGPDDADRVAEFLAEVAGEPVPSPSAQLAAARGEPMLMSDQVRRAWEDLVRAQATRPLVLLVEDLQWADAASVRAIDAALRIARDLPLFVLLVGRPESKDAYFRMLSERQPMSISLAKLGAKATAALVRAALGPSADPKTVATIVERSGGSPFFAEELVRAFSSMDGDEVPGAAIAVLEARLAGLEPEARRVLRAGSVLGQSFGSDAAAALLGEGASRDNVDAWCAWLVEREVLAQREPGVWTFRHALVRDAAYAMLTEGDRRTAHALAGAWLESHGERDPSVLAEHYARGGDASAAARWLAAAATLALEASDLAAVVDLATRALAGQPAQDEVSVAARRDVLVVLAEAHRWRGEYDRAATRAGEAMAELPAGGTRWFRAAAEGAVSRGATGDNEGFERVVGALLAASPASPADEPAAAIAFCRAALQLMVRGDPRADILVERAASLTVTELAKARLEQALATRAGLRGLPEEYMLRTHACVEAFERAGDLRSACLQTINLAFARLDLGLDARETLESGRHVAERYALAGPLAGAMHIEGIVLAREGKRDEALAAQREAHAAFLSHGSERLAGGVRSYVAELLLHEGKLDEALAEARGAAADLAHVPPTRARALAVLADVLLARGDVAMALERSGEAAAILESALSVDTGEWLIRRVRAEVLAAAGDPGAEAYARDAQARLRTRGATVTDESLRRSFFAVPENARLLALGASTARP